MTNPEDPYHTPDAKLADPPPQTQPFSIPAFCGWGCLALVLGVPLCLFLGISLGPRIGALGGLVQLMYIVPMCYDARLYKNKGKLAGLITGASLVLLVTVPCLMALG